MKGTKRAPLGRTIEELRAGIARSPVLPWGPKQRARARAEAEEAREREDMLMPVYTYTPKKPVGQVILNGSIYLRCPTCGRNVHLRWVGLRQMPDGSIRNQPRCQKCRKEKEG